MQSLWRVKVVAVVCLAPHWRTHPYNMTCVICIHIHTRAHTHTCVCAWAGHHCLRRALSLFLSLSLETDRERDRRASRPPPSRLLPASFSPPPAGEQLASNRSSVSMDNTMSNRARCCPWLRPWATSSVQTTALSIASFLIDGRVCEFSLVSLAAFVRAGSAESRGRKLVCRVVLLRAHSPGKCRCFALICLTDQLQNYGVLVRARPFVLFASSTRLVGRSIRRLVGRRQTCKKRWPPCRCMQTSCGKHPCLSCKPLSTWGPMPCQQRPGRCLSCEATDISRHEPDHPVVLHGCRLNRQRRWGLQSRQSWCRADVEHYARHLRLLGTCGARQSKTAIGVQVRV